MNIPSTPKQQGHEHSTPFSREKPPQLHFPGRPHGARDAPRAAGTRGDRRRADARSGQQPGLSPRHDLRDLHADVPRGGEVPGGRAPFPRGAGTRRADGVPVAAVRRHAGRLAAAGRQEPAVEGCPAGGQSPGAGGGPDGRAGGLPCPAAGPEGRPVQPGLLGEALWRMRTCRQP
ncbi:MAG: hypothetical protein OXF73_09885 [Gammaproteobacteria bacterium]|nr:hypothetical protein [Gammaproteobacteria bacterium]